MKYVTVYLTLLILSFAGCGIFQPPKDYFHPYCYDGKSTGLDTIINVNGYYQAIDSLNNTGDIIPPNQRTNHVFVFYKDGFFSYSIFGEEINFDERFIDWGLYKIYNDILKIRFVAPIVRKWRPSGEAWFKIIDKNTIEPLLYRYSGGITHELIESRVKYKDYRPLYAKYIPCDTLPNTDEARIKKDRVFWCNKEQYKEWKNSMKFLK